MFPIQRYFQKEMRRPDPTFKWRPSLNLFEGSLTLEPKRVTPLHQEETEQREPTLSAKIEEVGTTLMEKRISNQKPEESEIIRHIHLNMRTKLTKWRSQTPRFPNFLSLHTSAHLVQEILDVPPTLPIEKICWIFTIFFQTLTCIFKIGKNKIVMKLRIELRRITLPPMEKYLCFHEMILIQMRLTRGSHVDRRWGFSPTRSPTYLKGMNSFLKWRNSQARSKRTYQGSPRWEIFWKYSARNLKLSQTRK